MNVKKIRAIGDSNVVISQLKGEFAVKEPALAPYRTLAKKLVTSFEQISLEHIPCSTIITVMQRNKPCVENMKSPSPPTPGKNDWRESIKNEMSQLHKGGRLKMLQDYSMMFGELYRCLPGGNLARCIDEGEAQRRLKEIHEAICGVEHVVNLYRRLERKGFTAAITEDWRSLYFEYLISKTLPEDCKHAYKIKKTAKSWFCKKCMLKNVESTKEGRNFTGSR
ncbi:hypothetical protein ACLB2K_040528 [Fragaria x ananassa]